MGTLIEFPRERRAPQGGEAFDGQVAASAAIIILPVVRIERHSDAPGGSFESNTRSAASPRRRRRRSSRS